ncbi:MAG: ABC-2 family transporter protein [Candidatus Roizmanbacteria bacterium]|nr:ABC-2 family transporter protein [Candidatus Roizmanbacteria bacterium]
MRTTTQGRIGLIIFTLGKVVRFAFMFFLLFFIFKGTRMLKGYTFQEAALFYMIFNLIDTISQVLFREVYRFRSLVVGGALDTILLKPYHPFLRILLGGVDVLDVILLIPYTLITVLIAIQGHITLIHFIPFLILFLNALWIATSFHILVLALGILTTEVDHTILIYRDMTSLGRFPMAIYKEPIKSFFTFVIPIGIMTSFPPQALLGALSPSGFFISLAISSVLFYSVMKLWKYSLKKYQSWGG